MVLWLLKTNNIYYVSKTPHYYVAITLSYPLGFVREINLQQGLQPIICLESIKGLSRIMWQNPTLRLM